MVVKGKLKMANLVPINSVDLNGETIKRVLFVNVGGGDKTILIFVSGRVLVMPVYRACPVQVGTMKDLIPDFPEFLQNIESEKKRTIDEADKTISLIKELGHELDNG
jgi:hypothetical protein